MLVGSFKTYSPAAIIKVSLLGIVLWVFSGLYKSQFPGPDPAGMPIYLEADRFISAHFLFSALLSLIFTVCSALLLNYIVNQHNILSRKTYLPALFYLIYSGFSGHLLVLHPSVPANLFLIAACHELFNTYRKDSALRETFNAGMLVGLASLLYLPSLVLFAGIWITLIIFRPFIWREYLVALMGLLLPWIYFVVYYFWVDKLNVLWKSILQEHFIRKAILFPHSGLFVFLYIVFGLVIFLSLFRLISSSTVLPLKSKKILSLLFWVFLLGGISASMAPSVNLTALSFMAVPMAVFSGNLFLQFRKNWIGELLFSCMLLAILLIHFAVFRQN